jgi:hypothetical protein
MLTRKNLEAQSTFKSLPGENRYYDGLFDFCLVPTSKGFSFNIFCEVDGSMTAMCDSISDLEHLAELYFLLSGRELEYID